MLSTINQFSASRLSTTLILLISLLGGLVTTNLTAQAQTKPTISVPEFKNENNIRWWWWTGSTARELADALSNELTSTGNFTIVERQKLGTVLSEQELAELGIVNPATAAQKGQVTGAQYIILGKVTAYEENVSSESGGDNFGVNLGIFNVGNQGQSSEQEAYVAIDLRVVDSTTGEVVYTRTVEGRAKSTAESSANNVGFLGGLIRTGNQSQSESKAPVGKALRAGLIEITDYLSCVMVDQNSCLAEYDAKEERRRQRTKDTLILDE